MYDVHAKASKTLRPVKSDHSVSITNTSNGSQTYHVEYQNYILYSGNLYNINAKYGFDVTLNQGETTNLSAPISQDANFSFKGTYPLLCKTVITLNGKEVSSAQGRNYAYIE